MPENQAPKQPKEIDVFNRFSKNNKLKTALIALGVSLVVFIVIFFFVKAFSIYTISYETYGGTILGEEIKDQEYRYLKKVQEPKNLKKEGFYIEGYYKDEEFKEKFNFDKRIKKSQKIYVNWQPGYAVQLFLAEGEDDKDRPENDKTGITQEYIKLHYEQYVAPGSYYNLPMIYNTTGTNKHVGEQLLWFDNPECFGDPIVAKSFSVTKNIPLYGVWFDTNSAKFDITETGILNRYLGHCNNIYLPRAVNKFKNIEQGKFETGLWDTDTVLNGDNYSIFDKVLTDVKRIYINKECNELGGYAFQDCVSLERVGFLGNLIEEIPYNAFAYCESLTDLQLPSSIKIIGKNAFNSSGIKNLMGTENIETISDSAFINCWSLEEIVFDKVSSIGSSAFSNCFHLDSIVLKNNKIVEISDYIMDNVTPAKIYVPAELLADYKVNVKWSVYSSKLFAIEE